MSPLLHSGSQTLHIWHCAKCHLCLLYYTLGRRHCTFGIVRNAIYVYSTTLWVADIAHLALCKMSFMSPILHSGSQTSHIWHCAKCHLCLLYYTLGRRHRTFGIVQNAIYVSSTTLWVADIAHLALCKMPFMSTLLHSGSQTSHIWHCAKCHLCLLYYTLGRRHRTFGIVQNAIYVSSTTL